MVIGGKGERELDDCLRRRGWLDVNALKHQAAARERRGGSDTSMMILMKSYAVSVGLGEDVGG